MRDPKTGFVAVQALAPAVYSGGPGASLPPGSYVVESETWAMNKLDQSTGVDLLHGVVTPGPGIDLRGFNSAALIVDIGASTPSPTPNTYRSAEFGFGIRLQYALYPDSDVEVYEDCYDLRRPFPLSSAWNGFTFLSPNQSHQFNIVIEHRKYRLVTMVKSGFSIAAGATLFKGHPTNHPAL